MNHLTLAALAVGILSGGAYIVRRRWIDALLAVIAGVALAGAVGSFSLPGEVGGTLTVSGAEAPLALDGVRTLRLEGDGLRAAQWRDLPARPLIWQRPDKPAITLAFPREIALGRMFTLELQRTWKAPGRLQLLAENGQVLAEARGDGPLTAQWLPPVAESLVLKARLLDAGGKVVDQGPVPVSVREPLPLQVRGRFGAPSFDLRTLDQLLAGSNAVIDWQVELGKSLSRDETPRAEMKEPDLEIVDAAWFERAGDASRAALLARVAAGRPLLVLGANAVDSSLWSRSLQLALSPQPAGKTIGANLPMASGGLNPNGEHAGAWSGADGVWTRDWQRGRIAWLGVGDWHRYAISEPRQLALWWQDVLDRLGVRRSQDIAWLAPDEMPLPRQRLEACAQGVQGQVEIPALKQTLAWQRRPERVDASCVALWPSSPGWLRMQGQTHGAKPVQGEIYVYSDGDWPLWQRSQRREATAQYAARMQAAPSAGTRPLPTWPFGVIFVFTMLALWWRERR
jgi:hypothetical protein